MHNSGPTSADSSVRSLLSYRESLMNIRQYNVCQDVKGKGLAWISGGNPLLMHKPLVAFSTNAWIPPKHGWVKVNVDGTYIEQTGEAGIGMLARDHTGTVCFSAWRVLFHCSGPVEAEARACVEGLRLASQWVHLPVLLESDCSRVVKAFKSTMEDRSEIAFQIREGKELVHLLQEVQFVQVNRERNSAAHVLAQLARRNVHSAVWLRQVPSCIAQLVVLECNSSP